MTTPGPWEMKPCGRKKTPMIMTVDFHGPIICEMMAGNNNRDADTKLIAAAPELLDELKTLIAYIDRGNWADHRLDDILRAGRATIAKVETE